MREEDKEIEMDESTHMVWKILNDKAVFVNAYYELDQYGNEILNTDLMQEEFDEVVSNLPYIIKKDELRN
tara:strand:- start:287 stop:496 length:210 start_codon:yes stop_codon:yes gene_type:complete